MQQQFFSLTPKAMRVQQLRAQGKSFDKAFAIADSEYSSDGMSLEYEVTDLHTALSAGMPQMGEVQF